MGIRARLKSRRLPEKLLRSHKALGLSQNGIVDRFGLREFINRQNISSYENGELEPPLPALLLYAEAAGVCADALIDDGKSLPRKLPATPRHKP